MRKIAGVLVCLMLFVSASAAYSGSSSSVQSVELGSNGSEQLQGPVDRPVEKESSWMDGVESLVDDVLGVFFG
ncbi:hypothetical protein [Candidatus Nanohalococcus occultus]|uniref:hypothetical protein n=1 Tax=Candidatus Nanohalococcus occultus TaxID=2978047 RepID=UPI00325FBFF4